MLAFREQQGGSMDRGAGGAAKARLLPEGETYQSVGPSVSAQLSSLYALILVLVGLVCPVTEAIRDHWMGSHVVGVFNVYIYSIATCSLIYIHVFHVIKTKRRQKRRERKNERIREVMAAQNRDLESASGTDNLDDSRSYTEYPAVTTGRNRKQSNEEKDCKEHPAGTIGRSRKPSDEDEDYKELPAITVRRDMKPNTEEQDFKEFPAINTGRNKGHSSMDYKELPAVTVRDNQQSFDESGSYIELPAITVGRNRTVSDCGEDNQDIPVTRPGDNEKCSEETQDSGNSSKSSRSSSQSSTDPGDISGPSQTKVSFLLHQTMMEEGDSFSSSATVEHLPAARGRLTRRDSQLSQALTEEVQTYLNSQQGSASFSHESTNFYMRIGVLIFAIGNLLYVGLEIEYVHGKRSEWAQACEFSHVELAYPTYFWLVFLLAQTFFLFKNNQLIVHSQKPFVRFCLMHVLATNICIWIRVLVFEVMEAVHRYNAHSVDVTHKVGHDVIDTGAHHDMDHTKIPGDGHHIDVHHNISRRGAVSVTSCDYQPFLDEVSPFLFPFVLEYSLVGAAAMMNMYDTVDLYLTKSIREVLKNALRDFYKQEKVATPSQTHHGDKDLDKSHFGMFLGFIIMTGVLTSVVLFFYWRRDSMNADDANLSVLITDMVVNVTMLVAVIIGMAKFRKLGYTSSRENKIDHVLLMVSFAGLFSLQAHTVAAAAELITTQGPTVEVFAFLRSLLAGIIALQAILQTAFITDSMHRYVTCLSQAKEKPARGCITFLIVVNVTSWLFSSVKEKQQDVVDGLNFFGSIAWPIILNTSLPLLLFFRFHSSICLAHIWHSAYIMEHDPFSPEDICRALT